MVGGNNNRFELLLRGYAGSVVVGNYQSAKSLLFIRCMEGFSTLLMHIFLALDTEGSITTMYTIRVCNDGKLAA